MALFAIIRFRPDVKLVTLGVVVGFTGFTGFTGLTGLTGFTGFTGFTGLTTSLQVWVAESNRVQFTQILVSKLK